jgi:signal transduction histidine kinase
VRAERAYIDRYSLPLVDAARRGERSATSDTTALAGKRRVDALRAAFDDLVGPVQRASAESARRADAASRHAAAGAAVGLGGSLVLIAVFVAYLRRAIVRPVTRAARMAGRLAAGDLGVRLPESDAGEIGALERSFNVMGGSLERGRDALAALAEEQAALRRVATLVARGAPPEAVFAAVAEEAGRLLDAHLTALARYDPPGSFTLVAEWSPSGEPSGRPATFSLGARNVSTLVLETGQPARIDAYGAEATSRGPGPAIPIRSGVGAPISVEGRIWGVMVLNSTTEDPLPPGTEDRLAGFTDLVATAIANAQSQAELRASRARIVTTADETRRRIERDLHDGAQQHLVSLALQLRAAQEEVPAELPELSGELAEVAAELSAVQEELREFARGIHPAILAEGGLGPALRALARRSKLPVRVDVRPRGRLPEPLEAGAYYVVSEALTNVAKHARASTVAVVVEAGGGVLRVHVRDDGVGGAGLGRGSGLIGLKDRVEALGGRISLDSPPGVGTSLSVELPLAG